MKIVAISDTHNQHKFLKIPKCDVLVHCGDFTSLGKPEEIMKFKRWIVSLLDEEIIREVVMTFGNHEVWAEKNMDRAREMLDDPQIHILIDEEKTIDGVKFYGSAHTPTFFDWAFMEDEDALARRFRRIPEDTDVLVTHGPPFGHLDDVIRPPFHAGSHALLEAVNKAQPRYHCFGHLHLMGGRTKEVYFGDEGEKITTFVNAAVLDDFYKPRKNVPVAFEV